MTVENDFLTFATGSGANVESQSDYVADSSTLQNGFSSGVAQSGKLNKVWRQSSIMSAVLAQFIVNNSGQPAIDDGTTAALLNNLTIAINALVTSFPAPINNTGASSDITLAIGQSAYIDISAASSVPLHIACADNQIYEAELQLAGNIGISSGALLLPNNASSTNRFAWEQLYNLSNSPEANSGFANGFFISGADIRFRKVSISTKTTSKTVSSYGAVYISSSLGVSTDLMASFWQATASSNTIGDTTTAWTSLGTVIFPVAATGRIIIRRTS